MELELELVVRMHWPKGTRRWSEGRGGWHWPRPVNCTVLEHTGEHTGEQTGATPRTEGEDVTPRSSQVAHQAASHAATQAAQQAPRLECVRGGDAAEFWKRCRARLAATSEAEAVEEGSWGVKGANNLMQHALRDVDGWPTVVGGGAR